MEHEIDRLVQRLESGIHSIINCGEGAECKVLFGLTAAETYSASEGGNITGQCRFHAGGTRKMFCKNGCARKEDILVETSGDRGRKGRYSIEYSRHADARVLHVSIVNVTSADSGEYQCVLDRIVATARRKIRLNVTAAQIRSRTSSASAEKNLYFLLLLVLVPGVLLIITVIYRKKKMHNDCEHGQQKKTKQDNIYAAEPVDCIYQSLSAETRDHNQIYSSLRTLPAPHSVDYCNC